VVRSGAAFPQAGELHRVGAASGELLRAVSGVLVSLYWSWRAAVSVLPLVSCCVR